MGGRTRSSSGWVRSAAKGRVYDAGEDELRIGCLAATGCRQHEAEPPLEDDVRWTSVEGWETRSVCTANARPV
jgi:hypothetical protein